MSSAEPAPAAPPAGRMYRARPSALDNEREWRLTPAALECVDPGFPPRRFAYRDAVELRLAYVPSRANRRRYRCDLTLHGGARLQIVSTHYAGIADFEDRAATYAPFVRNLVQEVARATPACRLLAGRPAIIYIAEHAFLLASLVLLALLIGMVGALSLSGLVMLKLAIVAFYLPTAFLYARSNWPRRFTAGDIPAGVLPERE